MSHVTPGDERPSPKSRGEQLDETMDRLGVSNLELARRLAASQGGDVEYKRRQVRHWRRHDVNFNDTTAARLAAALELDSGYFTASPAGRHRRLRLEEEVAAIRGLLIQLADRDGIDVPEVLRRAENERAA